MRKQWKIVLSFMILVGLAALVFYGMRFRRSNLIFSSLSPEETTQINLVVKREIRKTVWNDLCMARIRSLAADFGRYLRTDVVSVYQHYPQYAVAETITTEGQTKKKSLYLVRNKSNGWQIIPNGIVFGSGGALIVAPTTDSTIILKQTIDNPKSPDQRKN